MHRQLQCNSVGNFKKVLSLFFILFCFSQTLFAKLEFQNIETPAPKVNFKATTRDEWLELSAISLKARNKQSIEGLSYIISGGLAIAGGLVGAKLTEDPIEQGAYALFESIGIASVGYGAYKWTLPSDDQTMINLLNNANFSNPQKLQFYKAYQNEKARQKKIEDKIKAVTHGLIATLNFYNGSQQKSAGIRNSLYFVGGINILATISYSF